jgi:hypothetical protein
MKRCQKCNFQSDSMLDYCWQCGTHLTDFSNAGNYHPNGQSAQGFNNGAQNDYPSNQTQGFNNYGQNYAPSYQSRAQGASFGRIAAVLGGIFVFLLLISGAGAAVIYRVINKPPVPRYEEDYRNPEPAKPSPVKDSEPVRVTPDDKRKSDKASTEFEKMWVDYNVTEKGRFGMRIHVKFSVINMKGVDSQLAIYFEKSDGAKLKSTSKSFSSKDGQVAVYRALKPGYDETVYKDLELFMPYDELKLERGKYDLKMDADVIYENGDLIEHMNYHDFQYEKK